MKIAYICADRDLPVFGNRHSSLHVQEMIGAFARDHDVTLLARNTGGDQPFALRHIDVHPIHRPQADDAAEQEQLELNGNRATAGKIKQLGLFDLVYERYSPWSHGALEAARQTAAVTVLEVNNAMIDELHDCGRLLDKAAALESTRRVFAAADLIIATAQSVADYLQDFSETRGKVQLMPRGINYDRYRPYMPRVPSTIKPLTLGFLGSLKARRGVDTMLRAYASVMRRIPNSRVRIIGDGPERPALEALCQELRIHNRVQFTGAVAPVEVPHQLGEMDIGLAPYLDDGEGCFSALKVCEYMASGLPVVASDINPVNRVIKHLDTGLLVEPGDVDSIIQSVIWLQRNPALSTRLAEHGQKQALTGHTWSANVRRVLELSGFPQPESRRSLVL